MKREFEAYRSNLYAFLMLIASLLFLGIAVFFLVLWIEWSSPIVIISFLLFVIFLLGFVLLYIKKSVAFYITKKEVVFCGKNEITISLENIESIDIKSNLSMLTLLIKTAEKETEFNCFIADIKAKKVDLIKILIDLGVKINDSSILFIKNID